MIEYVAHGIMLDDIVFPDGKTKMSILGGGGPQTAWGAAAVLGTGQTVGLIAGVNHDLDSAVIAPMKNIGVNLEGVRRNDLPTPRAWQVLEYDGRRRHVWRVPTDTLPHQLERGWDVAPEPYHKAKFFHWGIHPDDAEMDKRWAKKLAAHGVNVSLEPFQPPAEPLAMRELTDLLAHCKVFSVNWHEAQRISGIDDEIEVVKHYQQAGCHYLLLRKDAAGSTVWDCRTGEGAKIPAVETSVVDVVGAGNAYTGAFLASLDKGILEAGCYASAAASYLIEQVGLPHSLPAPDELKRRIDEARAGSKSLSL